MHCYSILNSRRFTKNYGKREHCCLFQSAELGNWYLTEVERRDFTLSNSSTEYCHTTTELNRSSWLDFVCVYLEVCSFKAKLFPRNDVYMGYYWIMHVFCFTLLAVTEFVNLICASNLRTIWRYTNYFTYLQRQCSNALLVYFLV